MSSPLERGGVWLLGTRHPDGTLRTRPVTVFPISPTEIVFLTGVGSSKLAEIRCDPHVTLAGPTPTGWWAAEGVAGLDRQPPGGVIAGLERVVAAAAAVVRVRLRVARRWTVHSVAPWDNTVTIERFDAG